MGVILQVGAWPLDSVSWQSLALLLGFWSAEFPSKWTGRHRLFNTSHAKIRCLVSRVILLIPQVPGSLLTVTNVNGCLLMHRLPCSAFPPLLLHTDCTFSRSSGLRKDCVGLSHVRLLMNFSHSFWSREVGAPEGRWRLMKTWLPFALLEGWQGASFLAHVGQANRRQTAIWRCNV